MLGITYFGFDPLTIKKRKEIQTIKSNLLAFKSFYILLLIFFVLLFFSGAFDLKFKEFIPSCIIFLMILFHIIMYLISLIVRINYIHNFIFKIIYKDEKEDKAYKRVICFYIINILILSSIFIQFLYLQIKEEFDLEDIINIEINSSIDKNPTRNNNISNDTINESLNINEYINHDINNKNNKSKQKEKMESPKTLNIINENEINNDISKQKEELKSPQTLIIYKNNEINNDISEPKERNEYPKLLNININKNKKNKIEDDKSKLQTSERGLEHLCTMCYENPIQVIFSPCGHRCLCLECYKREKENLENCPICNKKLNH